MKSFKYRGSTIEIYDGVGEKPAIHHIRNGVKTIYEAHIVLEQGAMEVQSVYNKFIEDTIGNRTQLEFGNTIIISSGDEYNQFANMLLENVNITASTFHTFITKRQINGMLQKIFSEDNVFCFNPLNEVYFQPMTMDVVVNNATIDNTDPENPVTNNDGEINITPVDGTPVVAKLYDGSVDYLNNLQGQPEAEISDMNAINFTEISGKKRVFLFDANGNFSHQTFDV